MTDIMKLADDYANACADVREFLGANAGMDEADGTWIASQQAAVALQSAIEALQEENALLEGTLESRGRNIAALQAENEQFRLLAKANSEALGAALVERDALQAKLDAMGKGEPVSGNVEILLEAAEVLDKVRSQCDDAWERFGLRDYLPDELHGTALIVRDAAPKALAPSREVIGRYMADKGFYLSKEALDGLMLKLEGIGGTP